MAQLLGPQDGEEGEARDLASVTSMTMDTDPEAVGGVSHCKQSDHLT